MNWLTAHSLIVVLVSSAACQAESCGARPRALGFGDLGLADRVEVIGRASEKVATIGDKARIQDAVAFIERHHEGWIDVWTGPRAPVLDFRFYQGTRYLGQFGIANDYIAVGGLSRKAPAPEIAALAKRLDLEWPSLR